MGTFALDHVALQVRRLQEAEVYYGTLFGAEVAFREARIGGEWRTLPEDAGWADAAAAGIELELSCLERDGFLLALTVDPGTGPGSLLDHIAVRMDQVSLDHLRSLTAVLSCRVKSDRPDHLVFVDKYGVHWEIGLPHTGRQRDRSTGARTGRWIELPGRTSEAGGGGQA